MPLRRCTVGGNKGWRWGQQGKCYVGAGARRRALRQAAAILASGWQENRLVHNAGGSRNPMNVDPTRTITLRRRFAAAVRRRFDQLRRELVQLVDVDDAFGLRPPTLNVGEYRFLSRPQQLEAFRRELDRRVQLHVLTHGIEQAEHAWWASYIEETYRKGNQRAFNQVRRRVSAAETVPGYEGSRREFLRSSFMRPASIEKVKLLASRVYSDLKGVTDAMSSQLSRQLVDGLARGDNPRVIGRRIAKTVDGIGRHRAQVIARTEVIRAHAEGQLDAMERLGVERVSVMVEWSTAGDDRVCPLCASLDGIVLKIKEARGLIPRHPLCRCAHIPANVGESPKGQVRSPAEIRRRMDESLRREMPKRGKRTLAEQKDVSQWGGAKRGIDKRRPVGVLDKPTAPKPRGEGKRIPARRLPAIEEARIPAPGAKLPTTVELPTAAGPAREDLLESRFAFKHHLPPQGLSAQRVKEVKGIVNDQMDSMYRKFGGVRSYIDSKPAPVVLRFEAGSEFLSLRGNPSMGTYNYEQHVIKLAGGPRPSVAPAPKFGGWTVGSDLGTAFRHEYAHHIWYQQMSDAGKQEWIAATKAYIGKVRRSAPKWQIPVSRYGATNSGELFSESFAAFTHPGYEMGSLPGDIEGFLVNLLKPRAVAKPLPTAVSRPRLPAKITPPKPPQVPVPKAEPMSEGLGIRLGVSDVGVKEGLPGKAFEHLVESVNNTLPGVSGRMKGAGVEVSFIKGGQVPQRPGSYGFYSHADSRIRLYDRGQPFKDGPLTTGTGSFHTSGGNTQSVLRHEYGHAFFEQGLSTDQKAMWRNVTSNALSRQQVENGVSKYAATNSEECFAEAFTARTHKMYKRGDLPDAIEEFFDQFASPKKTGPIEW